MKKILAGLLVLGSLSAPVGASAAQINIDGYKGSGFQSTSVSVDSVNGGYQPNGTINKSGEKNGVNYSIKGYKNDNESYLNVKTNSQNNNGSVKQSSTTSTTIIQKQTSN